MKKRRGRPPIGRRAMTPAECQRRYRKRLRARRRFWASSVHQGWETPADLGAALSRAVGGFDLDPCAATANKRRARVKAAVLLTAEDDGLAVPWLGQVYVNPPYGRALPTWLRKCATEAAGGAVVVALVPARPDTAWFHDYIFGRADIFMLRGRLRFGDGEQTATFPSAVVVWGADANLVRRIADVLPRAWHITAEHDDAGPRIRFDTALKSTLISRRANKVV
jgi:phage N-6-adenine-methyltransferase